jgi:N-acetylglucosaminyl-diphospho-decaprenol L-rhamnosyltransferase
MSGAAIAVVVVTYRNADGIRATLPALVSQLGSGDELVVVDNASGDGTAAAVRSLAPNARVLEQDHNLGFTGGCNAGADASKAPLLLFLNPDAKPAAGCLDALRQVAEGRPGWGAWQALVTMSRGREINSSGGVTHFLGMGWAGACEEPVETAPDGPAEVSFASGAALVVRRDAWRAVGGFDERYFMYGEDLDLGLRLWLNGYGVGVVPGARVEHKYAFGKGERKWFMLERNRWWTVLSDYPTGLLLLLLPALVAAEAALLVMAAQGGWLRAKLRAQWAVTRDLPQILARRREVQEGRAIGAAELSARLSADLDNPYLGPAARIRALAALQRAYWEGVRALLRLTARTGRD